MAAAATGAGTTSTADPPLASADGTTRQMFKKMEQNDAAGEQCKFKA